MIIEWVRCIFLLVSVPYVPFARPRQKASSQFFPRTSSGTQKGKKRLHNLLLSVRPSYQAPLPPHVISHIFLPLPLSSGLCILSYDELLDPFLVSWVPVQGGTEREHLVRPSVSPIHDTDFFSSPSPSPRPLSARSGSPSSTRRSPSRTRCDATSRGPRASRPFSSSLFCSS